VARQYRLTADVAQPAHPKLPVNASLAKREMWAGYWLICLKFMRAFQRLTAGSPKRKQIGTQQTYRLG